MKKIYLLIFLILMSIAGAPEIHALTLNSCVQKALETHPDVKRFILQVKHSQEGIKVAQADYLPHISLNAEYDPTTTYVMPANGIFQTHRDDGWRVGATLKQKIWDFSKTTSLIKVQKTQEEIASLSLLDAKALLAYKVKLLYELALVQQKAIFVRQKDLKTKEELYKQAEALVKQGMKTYADSTRLLSSVYVAKDNLVIARSDLNKAKTALALYIGEPIPEEVKLNDNLSTPHENMVNETSMLQDSLSLKILQNNLIKSELLYKATKAAHYGSIDAIASYNHQKTLNTYATSMVGIMLNIPLYSGGQLSAQEEQAIIDKQSAKNEFDAKVLALKEEFANLLIDLKRYEYTIKAKTSQLQAADQTKTVISARYKEGLATYIEVLDATALSLDAQLGLLKANYSRRSIMHRIEYLQGKIT